MECYNIRQTARVVGGGRTGKSVCVLGLALAAWASPLHAGWNGLTHIVSDAGGITVLAQPPGDPDRLFVGTKEGAIRILHLGTGEFEEQLFLNLLPEAATKGKGGLMGMTFHPDYQTNGKFYLTLTVDNGGIMVASGDDKTPPVLSPYTAEVREYSVSSDPNRANYETFNPILQWVKPYTDHTGGWLGFGPHDGMLYLATGDGGGYYDNVPGHTPGTGNAQDLTDNLMGKLLRIDVEGDDFPRDELRNYAVPQDNPFVGRAGDDEIFANGLRSPWRASFDRATGDLWLGDVGESTREEVNFVPADSAGGQNFGWRVREGADPTATGGIGGSPPPRNTHPVYDYAHIGLGGDPQLQGNSVIGGYVYRGADPELQGQYVFADFVSRRFWMFDPADPYGTVTNVTPLLKPSSGSLAVMTTMFEDAAGRLYVGTLTGDVFRLETDAVTPGDFQGDGRVDAADLAIWSENFGAFESSFDAYPGDADGSATVDGQDFLLWQQHLGADPLAVSPAGRWGGHSLGRQLVPEPDLLGMAGGAILAMTFLAPRRRR